MLFCMDRSCYKAYEISKLYHLLFKSYFKGSIFQKIGQIQGQGHRVKMFVPTERSCHKKYSSEISDL